MNLVNSRYCKINRLIGVPLGLWPYRRTIVGKIIGAFALICIFMTIVTQLTVFFTHEFSMDLLFTVTTGVVPLIVYIFKYFAFAWNMDQVKYFFEWMQSDYDSLTNEREIRLMEKSAKRGSFYSKLFLIIYPIISVFIVYPFLPKFFNIVTTLNQSHSLRVPIKVEYFVDQDRYFYWIMLHIDASTTIGASIMINTESTFIFFITHACGLFEIVGDRVERVLESSVLNAVCGKTYLPIHGQLVATIRLHQRVLKFLDCLVTSFLPHYFVLIAISVVSLSINLYVVSNIFMQLARAVSLMKITDELLTATILVSVHFFYMGCGNYIGQSVLDKGNELFTKTYYTRWNESPLPVQKMLLYMRQRCMKPTGLKFGSIYTASLEFFSTLINASMSYFTVLYSTA